MVLPPVTNTMLPSGLTATAQAMSVRCPGPLYRLTHNRLPVAVLYATVA